MCYKRAVKTASPLEKKGCGGAREIRRMCEVQRVLQRSGKKAERLKERLEKRRDT